MYPVRHSGRFTLWCSFPAARIPCRAWQAPTAAAALHGRSSGAGAELAWWPPPGPPGTPGPPGAAAVSASPPASHLLRRPPLHHLDMLFC